MSYSKMIILRNGKEINKQDFFNKYKHLKSVFVTCKLVFGTQIQNEDKYRRLSHKDSLLIKFE